MGKRSGSSDVLVIGGGAIGLSIAWRARERGMSVTVLERGALGGGTSRVAAGMLAPVSEVEFGEAGRRVLELGLRSASLWDAFAAGLEDASGVEVGLRRTGTLVLARDEDEARELERQIAFRERIGLATRRLRPSEARELEPALAPVARLALEAPDDHSVDPRRMLDALRGACEASGVELREHAPVARIETDAAGRVTGATLADQGGALATSQVVIAAGAWSPQLAEGVPVRPVRGQLLRLRDPSGPGMLSRVVRFEGGYLVPRADGRYVLGATMEERGFDVEPDVGGVYELLREAGEVVPGVRELKIEELCVGLRPGMPDNAPAIGAAEPGGPVWAAGHHRNGILLAPITAKLVAALLAGERLGEADAQLLRACDPRRFAPGAGEAKTPAEAVLA